MLDKPVMASPSFKASIWCKLGGVNAFKASTAWARLHQCLKWLEMGCGGGLQRCLFAGYSVWPPRCVLVARWCWSRPGPSPSTWGTHASTLTHTGRSCQACCPPRRRVMSCQLLTCICAGLAHVRICCLQLHGICMPSDWQRSWCSLSSLCGCSRLFELGDDACGGPPCLAGRF